MKLIKPDIKYKAEIKNLLTSFEENDIGGFWNIGGRALDDIDEYIQRTKDFEAGKNLPDNWVKNTTFWLINDDGLIVGNSNIRHNLTEYLSEIGGNIGYHIYPKFWQKGYGTKILELSLIEAKKIGLKKVLVTCDDDNIGSYKIIEKNRGILENKIMHKEKLCRRYWIKI